MAPRPSLTTMSVEILSIILSYLPQQSLHALLFTNSDFIEIAARHLYEEPYFASTYRFAQFTYTISHRPSYALMVRSLDLSYVPTIAVDLEGQFIPLAGWREFKYRFSDMYYVSHRQSASSHRSPRKISPKQNPVTSYQTLRKLETPKAPKSSHPPPSPMLKTFQKTRDIPVGLLCHVFAACRRLKKVNLSRIQLASDLVILPEDLSPESPRFDRGNFITRFLTKELSSTTRLWSPPSSPSNIEISACKPITSSTTHPWSLHPSLSITEISACQSISPSTTLPQILKSTPSSCDTPLHTFVSDVPKSWTWQSNELVPIYADEITYWLCTLRELEDVKLRGCVWLSELRARRLILDGPREKEGFLGMVIGMGGGESVEMGVGIRGQGLKRVDFRESGMDKSVRWVVEGSREEVERLVN